MKRIAPPARSTDLKTNIALGAGTLLCVAVVVVGAVLTAPEGPKYRDNAAERAAREARHDETVKRSYAARLQNWN